jgi:hypothetical protein
MRVYAQSRVFEAFRGVANKVRRIDVSIGRDGRDSQGHRVTCTVLAQLRDGKRIEVTATGDWPYAAIQRAAVQARRQLDASHTFDGVPRTLMR